MFTPCLLLHLRKASPALIGGVCLQLSTGFTVGYLVYTLGTLFTDASALNIGGAIGGAIAIAVFAVILVVLINRANVSLKQEYALSGKR